MEFKVLRKGVSRSIYVCFFLSRDWLAVRTIFWCFSLAITFLMPISWLTLPGQIRLNHGHGSFFDFDYKFRNPLSLIYLFTGARACGVTSDTLSQSSILLNWHVTKKPSPHLSPP